MGRMEFHVGPWLVQPELNRLVLGSQSCVVTPKAMEVLLCLTKRQGGVVSKEDLFQEVWPGTYVSDDSLSRCVGELRHAFHDTARRPWVIQTIAKRGYRVVAPVVWSAATPNGGTGSADRVDVPRVNAVSSVKVLGSKRRWLLVSGGALVFLLAWFAGLAGARHWHLAGSRTIAAIAVLPMTDLSGAPGQEYFADGMTEELITQLARLEAWKVISRTSVMRYKGTRRPLPEIARELAVDALVESSVRRVGSRVRITAQLIRADTDTHLWSRSFERELSDVLVLQQDIASEIAAELKGKMPVRGPTHPNRNRSIVPEAYECYLRGRYFLFREHYSRAASEFQQATAIDPSFVLAYTLLFEAASMENYRLDLPPPDRAIRALQTAQVLDSSLAEVQTCVGDLKFFNEWDWAAGEAAFRRATQIDPSSFDAATHYAGCLRILCRREGAARELRRALQLDPVSPRINAGWLGFLIDAHRYDEAAEQYHRMLELDQNSGSAYALGGLLHQVQGRDSEAVMDFLKSDHLQGRSPDECSALETAAKAGGLAGYWRKRIELSLHSAERNRVPPLDFASMYVRIGENDTAMKMLEAAYQEHAPRLAWIRVNALWDPLRSDPRFQSLLKRMRFPE